LSDPDKRSRYDRFGKNWQQGDDFRPPPQETQMSPEEFERMFGSAGFSDFFKSAFGEDFRRQTGERSTRHRRYRHRGADVRAELSLPVGAAMAGGKSRFEVPTTEPCDRCGGVGFVGDHVCPRCVGVGRVHGRRSIDLTIPAQVRDGMTMRLAGLGEPGEGGGEHGDLYLTIRLVSDDIYRFEDGNVEADLPVTPWEAALGAKVGVRTPDGTVHLTVAPGSRAGTRLRLRGKGFPAADGSRGDFYAVLRLAMPELTPRQTELMTELARAGSSTVRGGAREDVQ
jgi:DnaJ-class molecular chaperone